MSGTSGTGGRLLARVLTAGRIGSMAAGKFLFPTAAHAAFSGTDGPIVFSSNRTATPPFYPGPYNGNELFLVSPAGGTASQLTCTGQQDNHPFVSPDGTPVVFWSTRAGGSFLLSTRSPRTPIPAPTPP
jgi:Tol biopolymer transport system component